MFNESEIKPIAQRIVKAENKFIEAVMEQFNKTSSQAEKVLQTYRREKLVKIDPITGQFTLKHGVFWEPDVIEKACNT